MSTAISAIYKNENDDDDGPSRWVVLTSVCGPIGIYNIIIKISSTWCRTSINNVNDKIYYNSYDGLHYKILFFLLIAK